MSEKLNFVFFGSSGKTEVSRKKVVENLMTVFHGLLGQPKSVFLLDWMTNKEFEHSWDQADSLLSISLLPTNLLTVYLENNLESSCYTSSIQFQDIGKSYSYVVSLPASINVNIEIILRKFCDVYAENINDEIIMLIGKEVELSDEANSIESIIEYALQPHSLVDWILVDDKYQYELTGIFKPICCLNRYSISTRA